MSERRRQEIAAIMLHQAGQLDAVWAFSFDVDGLAADGGIWIVAATPAHARQVIKAEYPGRRFQMTGSANLTRARTRAN